MAPVYDIGRNGPSGVHTVTLGEARLFVAEGIFAQEIVAACVQHGVLAAAFCLRQHPLVTFWRRLTRDLRERRKPPLVLVRRGWVLMREQRQVIDDAVAHGCTPVSPHEASASASAPSPQPRAEVRGTGGSRGSQTTHGRPPRPVGNQRRCRCTNQAAAAAPDGRRRVRPASGRTRSGPRRAPRSHTAWPPTGGDRPASSRAIGARHASDVEPARAGGGQHALVDERTLSHLGHPALVVKRRLPRPGGRCRRRRHGAESAPARRCPLLPSELVPPPARSSSRLGA